MLIIEGRAELLDIYSIGLKTLVNDVPEELGFDVSQLLVKRLLSGISNAESSDDVRRECLDNLTDLLARFGHLLAAEHRQIMITTARQLEAERPVIRKRAGNCLGSLAVVAGDALLHEVVEMILLKIEGSAGAESPVVRADMRTLVQAIGTISRVVGHRLGGHLGRLVPLFVRICGDPNDQSMQDDTSNELREFCLPGLESIVMRSPYQLSTYMDSIVQLCLGFMVYDPNYEYGDTNASMEVEEEDAMSDDMSDDEYDFGSDDDDTSWKVRKATVKLLSTLVMAHPELQETFFDQCAGPLLDCFREREANVRVDIIQCLTTLLTSSHGVANASILTKISTLTPSLVKGCVRVMNMPDPKARVAVLSLVRTLLELKDNNMAEHADALLSGIVTCFNDKQNHAIKLDALNTMRVLMAGYPPAVVQSLLGKALPICVAALCDEWYKIVAEAVRAIGELVAVMRPECSASQSPSKGDLTEMEVEDRALDDSYVTAHQDETRAILDQMFSGLLPRLEAQDIDQEIKEAAISTAGRLIYHFGDVLAHQVPVVLKLLHQRLENEITRGAALRAISAVAMSPLKIDLSGAIGSLMGMVSLFLRQQSRALKQTTLECLSALVSSDAARVLEPEIVSALVTETTGLIVDVDMIQAAAALDLIRSCMAQMPEASRSIVVQKVWPATLVLARSSLLQGVGETSLRAFCLDLTRAKYADFGFKDVTQGLLAVGIQADTVRVAVGNISRCLAAVCLSPGFESQAHTFMEHLGVLFDGDTAQQILALLTVGEMGHISDLSMEIPGLKDRLVDCFTASAEGVKTSAAFALGRCAVGCMDEFLPIVLSPPNASTKGVANLQYLLLVALKEIIITSQGPVSLTPYLDEILSQLLSHATSAEDGVRSMVAECMGALSVSFTERLVPVLEELAADQGSVHARCTALVAMRFALPRTVGAETRTESDAADDLNRLDGALATLCGAIEEDALECRKAALIMVNTGLHANAARTAAVLREKGVMAALYRTLDFTQKRVVNLGPFKHRVDDGLPLRKAALSCVDTMLGNPQLRATLDVHEVLGRAATLLVDDAEVKSQMHSILRKLCVSSASHVANHFEALIEPLKNTIQPKKMPEGSGPEVERAWNTIRSGCRLIADLSRVHNHMGTVCRPFDDFLEASRRLEKVGDIIDGFTKNG